MKYKIRNATIVIAIGTVVCKIGGFFREIIIANNFGTSPQLDSFLVALAIPSFFISIINYVLPSILIPKLTEIKHKKSNDFFLNLESQLLLLYAIILILISSTVYFYSPFIIKMLAPGLSDKEYIQAINQTNWLTIYLFFGSLFPIIKSFYHTDMRFVIPSFAPLAIHLFVISFILILGPKIGIKSLLYGVIFGGIFQFIISFMAKQNFVFPVPRIPSGKMLRYLHNVAPYVIIIEIIGQSYSLIDKYFASRLLPGSISTLNYANLIFMLPTSIVGLSLGAAIFPSFSENYVKKNWIALFKQIKKYSVLSAILGAVITPIILFFSKEIISIIFERGNFTQNDTLVTATALNYFTIGLIAFLIHPIVVRGYYSIDKSKILLTFTFLALLLKIVLVKYFIENLELYALPLSTSISFYFNVALLTFYLLWFIYKRSLKS